MEASAILRRVEHLPESYVDAARKSRAAFPSVWLSPWRRSSPADHGRVPPLLLRRANGLVEPGSIKSQELADLPLVPPHHPNIVRLVFDQQFAEAGIVPHVAAEADVSTDMLAAVRAGVGDTILPLGGTDELRCTFSAQAIELPISLTASIVSSAEIPLAAAGRPCATSLPAL